MKKNVLIIGAGGVAQVVAHKCAQNNDVLGDIHIASRTLAKCQRMVESVREKKSLKVAGRIEAHQLDAFDVAATRALIGKTGAAIVINVGSAFLNMSVMSACIETGAAYIDTAIHEDQAKVCEAPPWYANHEWKRREEAPPAKALTVVLGAASTRRVNAYPGSHVTTNSTASTRSTQRHQCRSHGRYFPPISTRRSTSASSPPRLDLQNSKGSKTGCSRSARTGTCPWSAIAELPHRPCEIHSISQNRGIPTSLLDGLRDHYINVFTC